MNNLQNARRTIEKIDAEMAELFEKRMKAAEVVAEFKKENALPIEDKEREAELTAKNSEFVSFEYKPYYESLYRMLWTSQRNIRSGCLRA